MPGGDGHERAVEHGADVEADAELDELEMDAFDRVTFTDEELTRLALDAKPFDPFDPGVQQFGDVDPAAFPVIPRWYQPAPGIRRSKIRAAVMVGFAVAFAVITVGGFSIAYGLPEFVWE